MIKFKNDKELKTTEFESKSKFTGFQRHLAVVSKLKMWPSTGRIASIVYFYVIVFVSYVNSFLPVANIL